MKIDGLLWVSESFVNATEGYRYGDSEPYETFTGDSGELYRSLVKEYGRCIGKVFRDTSDGTIGPIGWVFLGRARYEDTRETYLREVWVTVHSPEITEIPTTTSVHAPLVLK